MDRADVRMVEGGRGLGFPLETAESLCITGELIGKKLQGYVATELEVFGFVNDTHPAPANLAEDTVMGNRLPHGLGMCAHWIDMVGAYKGRSNIRTLGVKHVA